MHITITFDIDRVVIVLRPIYSCRLSLQLMLLVLLLKLPSVKFNPRHYEY